MYQAKNFDALLGTPGFSDNLLKNHFTLYQGYVKNTNTLLEKLQSADQTTPEFAEMKRRFGWEWNGMRLHEYYFENLKNDGSAMDKNGKLVEKIIANFGSFDGWLKEFKSIGAMRGIGWVVLYFDAQADKLINVWVNEHDVAHLTGATPLLIMDVFEHAFILDYGLKRADYIEAFLNAVDWSVVEDRLK